MKSFVKIGVLFALLSVATARADRASSNGTCDLSGKFRDAVFNSLGKERALNESSFELTLIRRDNAQVLCQDSVQPDQTIYPASTIKTLVAVAVLRRVDRGEIKLTDPVVIDQVNAAVECQDWDCKIYGPGKKLTLQQLLWDMITVSNNLAANQLIDIASKPLINQSADQMGAHSVQVYRKVYNIQDPEPHVTQHNTATADGFVQIFREISTGHLKVLSESSRLHLVDLLKHQHWNDSLNAKWPSTPRFFHKTGDTSSATADSGFFYVGKNQEYIALLVGLQGFAQFQNCAQCKSVSGYDTLSQVGLSALKLTQALKGLNP